jgi:RNA 2',3'-cyclic 3'-phosphodiesterase
MQKRLFIAISVPKDIKKRIFRLTEREYKDLPVKWVSSENLHVTVNFLGYVLEEKIPEICESLKSATHGKSAFDIEFTKIGIGPTKEKKKMVWLRGNQNNELDDLKFSLDFALGCFLKEKSKFIPHLTLGRIKKTEWRKLIEEPQIDKDFKFLLPVSSVDLMESRYEEGKRIYYCLGSFGLNC